MVCIASPDGPATTDAAIEALSAETGLIDPPLDNVSSDMFEPFDGEETSGSKSSGTESSSLQDQSQTNTPSGNLPSSNSESHSNNMSSGSGGDPPNNNNSSSDLPLDVMDNPNEEDEEEDPMELGEIGGDQDFDNLGVQSGEQSEFNAAHLMSSYNEAPSSGIVGLTDHNQDPPELDEALGSQGSGQSHSAENDEASQDANFSNSHLRNTSASSFGPFDSSHSNLNDPTTDSLNFNPTEPQDILKKEKPHVPAAKTKHDDLDGHIDSDALATLASAALGCDQAPTNGVKSEPKLQSSLPTPTTASSATPGNLPNSGSSVRTQFRGLEESCFINLNGIKNLHLIILSIFIFFYFTKFLANI